ncbi:hypothetical protein [Pseudoxanthomonas sp. 10H]|uniref:hypothetical protein n=1 Tax=Pseudoxanthomonas sp. 10H TaxID=3242729 RepID=UPI003556569E
MPTWSPTRAALALSLPGHRPDPALEALLRRWLLLGLLAVALVPALRGSSAWLGWWPMWLVAMPAVAWWALHRFRLPARLKAGLGRRSRRGAQARRRARRTPAAAVLPRAA